MLQNGSEVVRFAYDPLGRRVEKTAAGLMTVYTYDGDAILREGTSAGTTTYVHGQGIDEPLARQDAAGTWRFYHADALGSIVALTDALGAVTGSRRYDAFGNLQGATTTPGYAFTAREWDPETGLYYYRARYYDPLIGRFISEDPIGFAGGNNFYVYVGNNPVNWIDPLGLIPCDGRWVLAGWNRVFNVVCVCYWLCVPCDGPVIWSGNPRTLPSTFGTIVHTGESVTRGDRCFCPSKPGSERDCRCPSKSAR